MSEGTIKFVVTESGELIVFPHRISGVEISHAFLSQGHRVLSAGQAEIAAAPGTYVGLEILPHSGYYRPLLKASK